MTRAEVIVILKRDNPRARLEDLHLYADAFLSYSTASANITEFGDVVAHPRTGTPISNPYLPILVAARKALQSARPLNTSSLWP